MIAGSRVPARSRTPTFEGRWAPTIAGVAFASAFLNWEHRVGEAVVRPFDALVILSAAILATRAALLGRVPRVSPGWPFVALCCYLGYRAVIAAVASSAGVAITESLQALELAVFYLVVHVCTRSVAGLRSLVGGLVPTVAGIAIWAAAWHVARGEFFDFKSLGEPKLTFGLLLVLVVALRKEPIGLLSRNVGPSVIGVVAVLVVLSAERKMWVAAGVAVIYLLLRGRPLRTRPRTVGLTLLALAVFVAAGPVIARTLPDDSRTARQVRSMADLPLVFDEDVSEAEFESSSNESRVLLTRLALTTFQEHPVAGIGPDEFRQVAAEFEGGRLAGRSPHNEYLLAAVETGLLGVVLLVWLTVATVRVTLWNPASRARNGDVPGSALAAGLAVTGIAANLFLAGGVLNVLMLLYPAAIGTSHPARRRDWSGTATPAAAPPEFASASPQRVTRAPIPR